MAAKVAQATKAAKADGEQQAKRNKYLEKTKLPYGKTHVAIASTHRFNCPATMAIETLEATSKYKNQKVYQLPPLSPTVYKNNVDKEIITRNNNFGACVDVVSNFYSSFRA
ncbi:hypothetical protein OUZ56_029355 [Daphnia magna]|uniref:Uncharacterized protein n=1 Tax=Daphnia magna TaxID=35525 RepID=A0ABR0B6K7_9CRUS|nr:hypothetical protein OUZ56_029355 [Daphnia magna]